ncbi:MAG: UDP-N-acetylmuramate:L-alanyl-gamma-D-glutamyl-meso-diaminopimelate ligase [Acidobacteriota bacterium]
MTVPHYHLVGICGTAMASLAGMLKARGYKVTGSDQNVYPPMSTQLEALGINIGSPYKAEHLQPHPDFVVIGNAIPRGNPEVEYTLNARLHYLSQAEVIKEQFIRGRHSVVVAGTHGKTTTTSLMAWVMEIGGLNPSFLIGGIAENFATSFRITDSNYFIIEGDEYDTAYFDKGPKFMHYLPDTLILNNIEFDHADIYRDLEAYQIAFRRLINLIPSQGRLIAGFDSPIVKELSPRALCPVEGFGLESEDAHWQAEEIEFNTEQTHFLVNFNGQPYGHFHTPLVGGFNIRNCLAVIAAADSLGIARESIAEALATFRSVKRRMQVRGTVAGVTIIDDFAHHPTAVRETLDAVQQRYCGRRLVTVFEPRSWSSRKKVFQQDYENAFAATELVVIAPVFESFKLQTDDQFSPDQLVAALIDRGKQAWSISGVDNIIEHLLPRLAADDVLVIMSNGGFDHIHEKMLAALSTRTAQHA